MSFGRGLVTETLPDVPAGLAPGGPIVPGVYAGNTVHTSGQAISVRLRLDLYAEGGSSEMAALTACTDAARTANTAASQTKRKGPARGGTCSLSGYARTLHYDSGRIERIPLFFSK